MGTGYARWKLLNNTFVAQIVQCTSCNPLQLFVDEYKVLLDPDTVSDEGVHGQ